MYNKRFFRTLKFSNIREYLRMNCANRYRPINDNVLYPCWKAAALVAHPKTNSKRKYAINTERNLRGVAVSTKAFRIGDIAYRTRYDGINQYWLPK